MKIFTIKRVIGLAAIYGAVQYARRHGGAKNALNELLGKAKDFTATVSNAPSTSDTGGGFSSAYAASSDLGGNGTKNHS